MAKEYYIPITNYCIVKSCKNNGTLTFPSDDIRRRQWIEALFTHNKPRTCITKNTRICTAHFSSKDFSVTPLSVLNSEFLRKRLKKTAIPTLFPEIDVTKNALITTKEEELNVNKVTATYSRVPKVKFVEELPYLEHLAEDKTADDPLETSTNTAIGADTIADEKDTVAIETKMTTAKSNILDSKDLNTGTDMQKESVKLEEVFVKTENSTAESSTGKPLLNHLNNDRRNIDINLFNGFGYHKIL